MLVRSSLLLTVPLPAGLVLFWLLVVPCVPLFPPEYVTLPVILLLLFLHIPVRQHSGIHQLFSARFLAHVLLDNFHVVAQLLPKPDASLGILSPQPSTRFFVMRSLASASALHWTFFHWPIVFAENCHTKTPVCRRMEARCGLTEVWIPVDDSRRLRRRCPRRIVAARSPCRAQAAPHPVSPSLISLRTLVFLRSPISCRPRCADAAILRCSTAPCFFLTLICRSMVLHFCRSSQAAGRGT